MILAKSLVDHGTSGSCSGSWIASFNRLLNETESFGENTDFDAILDMKKVFVLKQVQSLSNEVMSFSIHRRC